MRGGEERDGGCDEAKVFCADWIPSGIVGTVSRRTYALDTCESDEDQVSRDARCTRAQNWLRRMPPRLI